MPERRSGRVGCPHAPSARRPLLAVLAAMAAVLAGAVPAAAQDPTTLTIVETATVRATPDAAELDASVERSARTCAGPRQGRAPPPRAAGRPAGDRRPAEAIRTGSFETYTIRRKGRRIGHAIRGVAIRVDDLAQLEAVVTALGGAIQGEIDFIVSDPTDERAAATAIALQRAHTRADAAAAALGMRVLGIRTWTSARSSGSRPASDESEDAAARAAAAARRSTSRWERTRSERRSPSSTRSARDERRSGCRSTGSSVRG